MHKLEQPHQSVQIFCIFYKKNLLFLFYTSTFTKHSYQFIYFTHLFNKIFILLHFLLFSHSWHLSLSLSLSLSETQPPSSSLSHHQAKTRISQTQILWFFLFLILMVDQSRNLDEAKTQIKSKSRPIQAEDGIRDLWLWLEFRRVLFRSRMNILLNKCVE